MSLQEDIIAQLGVKPVIDPQEEIRRSIDFLKDYLQKHPFLKTFVLGISGGQDSTLAGRLAQLAMEEMRSETGDASYQFVAVRLPYGVQADEADAQRPAHRLQIRRQNPLLPPHPRRRRRHPNRHPRRRLRRRRVQNLMSCFSGCL